MLDPRTLSRLERQVSGCAWALIVAEFDYLPWVFKALGQLATHDRHGVVLRTVVRNDEFKMPVRLSRQVINGVCDPFGRVVRRHNHADQLHRFPPPSVRSGWRRSAGWPLPPGSDGPPRPCWEQPGHPRIAVLS